MLFIILIFLINYQARTKTPVVKICTQIERHAINVIIIIIIINSC